MEITIYHNSACGTSRNTLALIRNTGAEPQIVEYLKKPLAREQLRALIDSAGITVRQAVRSKEDLYSELGLDDPAVSDDSLLEAMAAHPALLNRPFVSTPLGTRLCRPSEIVLDILPLPQLAAFTKEDGEAVINAKGEHVSKTA